MKDSLKSYLQEVLHKQNTTQVYMENNERFSVLSSYHSMLMLICNLIIHILFNVPRFILKIILNNLYNIFHKFDTFFALFITKAE